MPQVENETGEDVDYIVEDEENRTDYVFRRLKAGRCVDLEMPKERFTIAFYRRKKGVELMARKEDIPKDADLRVVCSEKHGWEIEVHTPVGST